MSPRQSSSTPYGHFLMALLRAELRTEPYDHMVIDDAFPQWYYRLMLDHFPHEHQMVHPWSKAHTYTNVRQLDLISDPVVEGARDGAWSLDQHMHLIEDRPHKLFWASWRRTFMQDATLLEVLSDIFARQIPMRPDEQRYAVGRLAIDYEGAGLGPHIDRIDKRLSMVFYLAPEEGHPAAEALGTKLLRLKNPELEVTDRHYGYDDFEVTGVAEYRPNRLIMWPVTPNSFHAYEQTYAGPRRTIKMFIQDKTLLDAGARRTQETADSAHDWKK